MRLPRFISNAIIVSAAMPVVLGNIEGRNDQDRGMGAFQDAFQKYLQSEGEEVLKQKDKIELPTLEFSGDGNTVALRTQKRNPEGNQSWHVVEVYRSNGHVWEMVNEGINIKTKDGVGHPMMSLSDDGMVTGDTGHHMRSDSHPEHATHPPSHLAPTRHLRNLERLFL